MGFRSQFVACSHHHEVTLVQLIFDFYMIEANPDKLIGDKAYDSDTLDDDLGKLGIDMIDIPAWTNKQDNISEWYYKMSKIKSRKGIGIKAIFLR